MDFKDYQNSLWIEEFIWKLWVGLGCSVFILRLCFLKQTLPERHWWTLRHLQVFPGMTMWTSCPFITSIPSISQCGIHISDTFLWCLRSRLSSFVPHATMSRTMCSSHTCISMDWTLKNSFYYKNNMMTLYTVYTMEYVIIWVNIIEGPYQDLFYLYWCGWHFNVE